MVSYNVRTARRHMAHATPALHGIVRLAAFVLVASRHRHRRHRGTPLWAWLAVLVAVFCLYHMFDNCQLMSSWTAGCFCSASSDTLLHLDHRARRSLIKSGCDVYPGPATTDQPAFNHSADRTRNLPRLALPTTLNLPST